MKHFNPLHPFLKLINPICPHLVVEKERAGGADNDERTAGQQSENRPSGARDDQRLRNTDGVVRFRAHQTAKGDGAGQSRKVDENDGSQALGVEAVL